MRYGIISDIHGNYDALEVVLKALDEEDKVDRIVCLGDVVGYGAMPRECVAALRERDILTVAGNHDFAVIGRANINYFNSYAREATLWTREVMTEEEKDWLRGLPLVEYVDDFTMVHGTLYRPELFDYIQTTYDAYLSLQILENRVCFVGHSHVPISFFMGDMISYSLEPDITLDDGMKALVNVGSVGQPRDDNPKSAYAVYDSEQNQIWIRRKDYDIEQAGRRIIGAGLPEPLAERLKHGR